MTTTDPVPSILVVMAKAPEPGRVKTRLTPEFTPTQAADLAEAALSDTLAAVLATPARRRILAIDGEPGPWLPAGIEVLAQRGDGLDERIANVLSGMDGPTLLVGMDTPQLTPTHLTVDWTAAQAWFGPAHDGGYWALGLREPDPDLVRGVPMSRADTGARQLERLHRAGLRVGRLPILRDVDTARCAAAVAAQAPHTRFARRHRALRTPVGTGHG